MAGDTRHRMLVGAARLLAERGLQQTSFSEVLELTGAPRGSVYHHFPGGKDELVSSAVDLAGAHAIDLMERTPGTSASDITRHFLGMWREILVRSNFTAGCSVLAVTVATNSPDLLAHAGTVFRAWRLRLAQLLLAGGMTETDAGHFAALLIAASEGAVVLSRAERATDPFDLVAEQLLAQVDRLTPRGTSETVHQDDVGGFGDIDVSFQFVVRATPRIVEPGG